jgi:MFS superfamily sulfate permease-like transporter
MKKLFKNASADIPASVVVFLVALPLCPGIALSSGTPLFSVIIDGMHRGVYDQSTIHEYVGSSKH